MCCVIPPASPAATSVSRIESSSEVLPWSTWPMIVTTGGRALRSSSASSKTGSAVSSSAALTTSTFLSNSSAITPIASSDSVCVMDAISPSCISFLITSETWTPRCSATSRTVAPEGIRIASGSTTAVVWFDSLGSGGGAPRPRLRRRRCGGGGCGAWRREACESITTRRRRPPPPPPPPGGRAPGAAAGARRRRGRARRGRCARLLAAADAGGLRALAARLGLGRCARLGRSRLRAAAAAGLACRGLLVGRRRFGAAACGRGGLPLPAPLRRRTARACASASSTVEAAALTSMPAAFSAAIRSLLETPFSLAIS